MKISSLNIFSNKDQIAWVGAGGKTSLIFSIARELFSQKCVITTSTKMALEEITKSDQAIKVSSFKELYFESLSGVCLLYKDLADDDKSKITGLDAQHLETLSQSMKINEIPLLIEADGSKRKSLKFPGIHEPNIPEFVNKVCVVAGLSVIGKPLSDQDFHRPNEIAQALGISLGDIFTADHLFKILTNPEGGLKNIPQNAEKIVFLHQADQMVNSNDINILAYNLKKYFDHVILSHLENGCLEIVAHWGNIGCVILAAGSSSRFGSPKQLAIYNNETFIETVIQKALNINFSEILVVLGAFYKEIYPLINKFNVRIINNHDWEKGQATSVKTGVTAISKNKIEAILFLLVDQPQISTKIIKNVLNIFAYQKSNIIVHSFNEQNSHPILFSHKTFSDLLKIEGDQGGRQLFKMYSPMKIKLEDSILAMDIDSMNDLKKINNTLKRIS
ncbi:MAG: selenium cofactor biosynthesis protein YqeC [Anaerolineaceae bacterium]|nr:selenium cofactor biosynthesis protein YqeC [Anaerolineaceae bacterium]